MCGIVGSFPAIRGQALKNSLDRIRHRGPDEQQQVHTGTGSLGHARLAILDVADGHQPMQDGHCWIAFNGEIYNYQTLRQQLPGPFHTNSDTEVVLRCYQEKGLDCPSFLDGMFAFAILDGEDLFLARDPIGIKPLYFARLPEITYFASEIKALLPFTSDIQEFPPGFSWHSRYGFRQFYRLDPLRQVTMTNAPSAHPQALAQIQSVLLEAVTKRLIADDGVTVGISLSGGLDSSIIAALARLAKERINTFAVSMPEGEDLPAAQQMAQFLGTRHHTYVYTFAEMLKALPEIIYYLESYDAALVRSAIPNYFLARLASDHVKVILTGEGADELFAGYEYLKPVGDAQALQDELWTILRSLHNTNLQRTDRMTMAHGIEGRVPFLDRKMVETAFHLPAVWKVQTQSHVEKELLRRSFHALLPESIALRPKQKFSKGTGSANLMAEYARQSITDQEFESEQMAAMGVGLRSKEELFYYRIFREQFGDRIPQGVIGRTRSVTHNELN